MKDKILIFGHKNPDTDSVCSAISLSYLKNTLGYNTEPRILSGINDETKFVLNRFGFKIPEILTDVKLKISDVNYHKDFNISIKESVYNSFFEMQKANMSTIPLIDENGTFMGAFAMKDIAKREILEDNKTLKATFRHILETINGEEILKFDDKINGNILNIAIRSTTFNTKHDFNKDTILIVGDRHAIIEEALKKGIKLLIITSDHELKNEHLELAKENKVNVIYTRLDSYDTLMKIGFANTIENYRYTKDLVCVTDETDVTELNEIINKTKHSYYPVIDKNNKCLGLIKLADLNDFKPKKVILVDHNQKVQSAEGLEEAELVEIVDHHNLGIIGTSQPINVRNMTVGSTCTILYGLFEEYNVEIPQNIAALLLSGIISDTLLLKSPTATETDKKVLDELIKITGLNAEEYAIEMFKANDSIPSKTISEVLNIDCKKYQANEKEIVINQVTTLNSDAILDKQADYINYLNEECANKNYEVFVCVITDIFKNGSYIIFNENALNIVQTAFGENVQEGDFIPELVSRKKQILPPLMEAIK